MVEHSVMVMSARLNPMGSQFSILVLESVMALTVETQLRTPTNGGPSSITVRLEYLCAFQCSHCELCVWKTDEGEAESIVLLIFVLWSCLNLRWTKGGRVSRKSYLAEIVSFPSQSFSHLNQIWFKCETALLISVIIFNYKSFDQQSSADRCFSK